MFRASSAHLQEDTVVYMQHMVLSFSARVRGVLSLHSCAPTGHHELGMRSREPVSILLEVGWPQISVWMVSGKRKILKLRLFGLSRSK